MNSNMQIPYPYQFNNNQSLSSYQTDSLIENSLILNSYQCQTIPPKIIKSSLVITSANIPQDMKNNMIQNLLINNINPQIFQQNQANFAYTNQNFNYNSNIHRQNQSTQGNPRILFKKEEDERIKKLVEIFGTRHWDLVAQFMEGRTAKQCRDRYSNYLIPGYFQGEWSDEEDELLIKLYKEHGPRWSIIQKSFHNRSSNNIKNRWYYFLHKKVEIVEENNKNESKTCLKNVADELSLIHKKEIAKQDQNMITENGKSPENKFEPDEFLFMNQENDIFDSLNNLEQENEWVLFD